MSFLPPVVLEIRAQAAQFFAEMAKVTDSVKAMATETGAATTGMADKVSASAAGMGRKVAASAEAMAAKTSTETEAMARRVIAESEQMNVGVSASTEAMVRKVVVGFDAMGAKATAAMEKQAQATVTAMEAQAAKVGASEEKTAAAVQASTAKIVAALKEQSVASERTATTTQASGLKMQETFAQTAVAAVASTGKMNGALAGAALTQVNAARSAEANLMGIANGITKVAGVTAIAVGAIGLHMAAEFEKSTNLLVTAGGESKRQLESVRAGILDISEATGTSAEQLSDGMYVAEKAGYRGAAGLAALRAAAEGAKAENVDLATMMDGITTTLLDYGYNMSDAAHATDSAVKVTNMMVAASGAAKTTMRDYVSSLAAVVPIASAAKISFQEVGGAIATMTQHGQTAQQSSQNLANMIQSLIRPNNMASASMQQMGIDTVDLGQRLGSRGLMGTLKMLSEAVQDHMGKDGLVVMDTFKKSASAASALKTEIATLPPELAKMANGLLDGSVGQDKFQKAAKATGGTAGATALQFLSLYKSSQGVNDALKSGQPAMMTYQAAMTKMLGNVTAARAATMLLMNGSEDLNRSIALISDAADKGGQHIETWADTQKTLSVQLDQAQARTSKLAIEIGTKLIPAANGALSGFADLFHGFEEGNPALLTTAGILGGVMVISIAAYTAKMVEAGIASVSTMVGMGARAIAMGGEFVAGFMASEVAVGQFSTKAELAGAKLKGMGGAMGTAGAIGAVFVGVMAAVGANTKLATTSTEDVTKALAAFSKVGDAAGKIQMDRLFQNWNSLAGQTSSKIQDMDGAIQNFTHRDVSAVINDWADNALQPLVGWLGVGKSEAGQLDDKFNQIGNSLGDMAKGGNLEQAASGFNQLATKFMENGKSAQHALDVLPGYKKALQDVAAQSGETLAPQELLDMAMGKMPGTMKNAAGAVNTYKDAAGEMHSLNENQMKSFDDLGISVDGEITKLGKLYDAMVATGLANLSARDAEFHFGDAMDTAAAKAQELSDKLGGDMSSALNDNKTDFNKTTAAGREAENQFSNIAQAGLQSASVMAHDVTKSQEDVTKSLRGTYDGMVATAEKFGLGSDAALELARSVLGVPKGVSIESWMNDAAKRMAEQTKTAIDNIPKYTHAEIDLLVSQRTQHGTDQLNAAQNGGFTGGSIGSLATGGKGMATGGVIPGLVPASPMVDNIQAIVDGKTPLRVRSGEFLTNSTQTKQNLPWLKAINEGLNMNDLFKSFTPALNYATASGQPIESKKTFNDNRKSVSNSVTIHSTADAKSLYGEFSRMLSNQ
jgi:TP901 family phage tail tape measure protein